MALLSPPLSSPGSISPRSMLFWKTASSCPSSHLPKSKPVGESFSPSLSSGETSPSRSRGTARHLVFRPLPLFPPWWNCSGARDSPSAPAIGAAGGSYFSAAGDLELDFEEEDEEGSPWEGAVVYRRDSSVTHLEYCTTLERLGLGKLSTELSMSRASAMGIRLTASAARVGVVGDPSLTGTPVLISIDVTRKKRKLKLDGILRTVIVLGCNRCGGPAAESVFSNFTFLLTEDPIEEEGDEIDLGTIFGSPKSGAFTKGRDGGDDDDDDDDEESIDLDDRLYFPAEENSIDVSKNLRDLVHLEITINSVCDPSCKGLCLKCGTNLNTSRCRCDAAGAEKLGEFGPLGSLKQQMGGR